VIGRTVRQASLFAFAFFKEAAAIRDPVLDSVDRLLEDPTLLALSTQALASRSPGSDKVGRQGIAQAGQQQLKHSYKTSLGWPDK
jgi:hypothetical protein